MHTIEDVYTLLDAVNKVTLLRMENEIIGPGGIKDQIKALQAGVAALPAGGGLTPAQAKQLIDTLAAVTATQTKLARLTLKAV